MKLTVKKGNPDELTQAEKKAILRESKKGVKVKFTKGLLNIENGMDTYIYISYVYISYVYKDMCIYRYVYIYTRYIALYSYVYVYT
jgi:hypothetical protein